MPSIDDDQLDTWLRHPLPEVPAALLESVKAEMRARHRPAPAAAEHWLARLAEVHQDFQALLAGASFPVLATAARGEDEPGKVTGDADAALGHTLQGHDLLGQIFLTRLESPADLEVQLFAGPDEVVARELTDAHGRFRFRGLAPGAYRLSVPALPLEQDVEVRR